MEVLHDDLIDVAFKVSASTWSTNVKAYFDESTKVYHIEIVSYPKSRDAFNDNKFKDELEEALEYLRGQDIALGFLFYEILNLEDVLKETTYAGETVIQLENSRDERFLLLCSSDTWEYDLQYLTKNLIEF